MRAFAALIDAIVYTRSRNEKLRLIGDYLKSTPDPDRGWALAALTGEIDLPAVKPAVIRALIEERRLCRRHGGDGGAAVADRRAGGGGGGRAAQ